jgi:hypothetical protein
MVSSAAVGAFASFAAGAGGVTDGVGVAEDDAGGATAFASDGVGATGTGEVGATAFGSAGVDGPHAGSSPVNRQTWIVDTRFMVPSGRPHGSLRERDCHTPRSAAAETCGA